jgi:hypothetical protein
MLHQILHGNLHQRFEPTYCECAYLPAYPPSLHCFAHWLKYWRMSLLIQKMHEEQPEHNRETTVGQLGCTPVQASDDNESKTSHVKQNSKPFQDLNRKGKPSSADIKLCSRKIYRILQDEPRCGCPYLTHRLRRLQPLMQCTRKIETQHIPCTITMFGVKCTPFACYTSYEHHYCRQMFNPGMLA